MIRTAILLGRVSSLANRLKHRFRTIGPDENGAALLDFALVAGPFFLLLIGIFEVAMVMFTQTMLQGATQTAAREIRTGIVQKEADPEAAFRIALCDKLIAAIACDTRLVVDVRTTDSFADVTFPTYYGPDGLPQGNVFFAGKGGQIVVVRAAYTWSIMTPLLGYYLANNGAGGRIINATVMFQNEPF